MICIEHSISTLLKKLVEKIDDQSSVIDETGIKSQDFYF
jgi:hypothetical protein